MTGSNIEAAALLQAQEELMREILELTKRQSAALEEDDIDALNAITDDKQRLIDEFGVLRAEYETRYRTYKQGDQINQIIVSIIEIETENKLCLAKKMEELKKEFHQIQSGRKGVHDIVNLYSLHLCGIFFFYFRCEF